jgi:hypothetical protein
MSTNSVNSSRIHLHHVRFNYEIAVIVAIALSLVIRLLIPSYFAYGSVHDDELMLRMARRLIFPTGNAWDQFAIQKEPGYSYLLAVLLKFEISPVVVVHLLYLAATYWLFRALRKVTLDSIAAICVICICLNPGFFGIGGSRIYNVSFQTALIVGLCAATIDLMVTWDKHQRFSLRTVWSGLVLMFVLVAVSITRPDYLFFTIPILGCVSMWNLISRWRNSYDLLFSIVILTAVVASPFLGKTIIRQVNSNNFGVYLVNDVNEGNFKRMMETLASIEEDETSKFIVVSSATLRKVEKQSETFALLSPFLRSREVDLWQSITCDSGGPCNEIAGGYLPLMLRDGIVSTFEISSAREFQRVTGQIADEVEFACDEGRLQCGAGGIGAWLPPAKKINFGLTLAEFAKLTVGRTYSFSDRTVFSGIGEPFSASAEAVPMWNILREKSWGLRSVTIGGTPNPLRSLISHMLAIISIILRVLAVIGTSSFLLLGLGRKADSGIVRIGVSMLFSTLLLTSFYALMYANSFGTSVDGGNLAYLMMAQPVALVVASFGFQLFADYIRAHQSPNTIKSVPS